MKNIIQRSPRFGSGKWFWLSIIAHSAMADKSTSTVPHLQRKECNKYDLTAAQRF
jgi:hypothetical protein